MDEHSRALPQPPGDLRLLLAPLLPGTQGEDLSLPRDPRGSSAGSRTRVLWPSDRVQV